MMALDILDDQHQRLELSATAGDSVTCEVEGYKQRQRIILSSESHSALAWLDDAYAPSPIPRGNF